MKYLFTLMVATCILSADLVGQEYVFRYNPYSGYNTDQLNLALEQSKKMKRNGIIATGVGTGMLVGGTLFMVDGLNSDGGDLFDVRNFGIGLGVMCASGFPLGYGMVAWIMGAEQIKQIEIELLATRHTSLKIKPSSAGYGLVYTF